PLVPDLRFLQVVVVFCVISAYEPPIAMAFASLLSWGGKFLLALTFPPLLKLWGGYVYLLFMAVALKALWVTWFRMPETRGRSFDDIAEEFRGAEALPLQNNGDFNTFK
ncbi:hypothetical protein NHX12_019131, partial [Muraenolepis orangiensis]